MQTATQIAYRERRKTEKQAQAAFVAVAKQEFPVGCEVRWIHTYKYGADGHEEPKYLSGVIKDFGYEGGEHFTVRRSTGVDYSIAAHRLEPVRSNAAFSRPPE